MISAAALVQEGVSSDRFRAGIGNKATETGLAATQPFIVARSMFIHSGMTREHWQVVCKTQ